MGSIALISFFISSISLFNTEVFVLVFITAKLASLAVVVNTENRNTYEFRRRDRVALRKGEYLS
jgi:hypothetical protein